MGSADIRILFLLQAVAGNAGAAAVSPDAVFSPHAGVVCDRAGHFCAGPRGISPWLTGHFLGEAARRTLADMTGDSGGVDLTRFELSNGVWCSVSRQTCWQQAAGGQVIVSGPATRTLFGTTATPLSGGHHDNA